MRQKYVISREGDSRDITIREYAIIDKDLRQVETAMLRDEDFEFLCEETYSHARIERSIPLGREAVVDAIRTPSLFPIRPYVVRIAESVMGLFDQPAGESVALIFDDADLVAVED